MTRSQPVFALPALALSLIAAGLFTACGSKPAAEVAAAPPAVLPAAAPEQVVADLYAALNTLRPSGAPTDTQRLILAPLLSAELTGLLQRADAARAFALRCGQGAEAGAGQPLVWMPWQCMVAMVLLARRRLIDGRKSDTPATKALLLSVARGNGKTEFAASLLMGQMADPTTRLEFSSVSTTGDKAQVTFRRMKAMAETLADPEWKASGGSTGAHPGRIRHGGNTFTSLPCTDKALDGLTTRCIIADEVARMDRAFGRLMTGLAKFPTSQLLAITTPDPGQRIRPIWGYWEALERAIAEDRPYPGGWWPMLYGLDADDQAEDESTWIKANPAIGTIVDPTQVHMQVQTMQTGDPLQISEVETQWLCRYVELTASDVDTGLIQRQMEPCDWDRLRGAPAVIAIDLSRGGFGDQLDLTTVCLAVLDGNVVRARNVSFWAGMDPLRDERRCKQPITKWIESGALIRMPGEWQDMAVVADHIEAMLSRYDVRCIAVDQCVSQASDMKRWQDRGWPVVPIHQGIMTMGPAWKLWGDWLRSRQLFYEPDPVLLAAVQGIKLFKDINGNIKPNKAQSHGNTDAVIAGMMAALVMDRRGVRETTGLAASACPIG